MAIASQANLSTPVQRVLERLTGVRASGQGYLASCPNVAGHAHGDRHPSLKINQGLDGRVLLHCHTGCDTADVVAALGLQMADLFAENGIKPLRLVHKNGRAREIASYPYHDEDGVELYQTVKYEPKGFSQRRPDGRGGYVPNLDGVPRVLYRLPEILATPKDVPIYIVEGEKDAEALSARGLVATTNVGGAGQWRPEYNEPLRDRPLVILPDNDQPGTAHAESVTAQVGGVAASIKVVQLPGLGPKGDVSDWLALGGTREQLEALVANCSFVHCSGLESDETADGALPSFPIEVFPPDVQHYLATGAAAVGVPVDMIAAPLLGFAGAALGNRHSIELKAGFQQNPTLYVASVHAPGSAKSPARDLARYPLDVLQREAYERFKEDLAAYEADLQVWQDTKKAERGEKPERPVMEHYYTTDATMEAAAVMLSQSCGVVLDTDEMVGWVKSCDMYRGGKGGDRQRWLSQWAGAPLKVDRKGADPIFVAHPCMPVVGGIQPELLPELADEAGRRDGFIERILWEAAPAPPSPWSDAEVSDADKAAMVALFRLLRQSAGDRPVQLSPEARQRWIAWYNENTALVDTTTGIAQGIYAKLPNQAARLALILHALKHPANPPAMLVSEATMDDAIELAEYFRAHAQAILPYFQAATPKRSAGLVGRVRRILERAGGGAWLNRRTLHQRLGGSTASAELTAALELLEAEGLAERQTVATGHRPAECWRRTTPNNEQMNNWPSTAEPSSNGHSPPTGVPLGKATVDRTRYQEGLDQGLSRDEAKEQARVSVDPPAEPTTADYLTLREFLKTECLRASTMQMTLADFTSRYCAWCVARERVPVADTPLLEMLPRFQVGVKPSSTTPHTFLVGITLKAETPCE